MNYLDREQNRRKSRQVPSGTAEATEGSIVAKHVIGIAEADRGERAWGRRKIAARLGVFTLLGARGIQHVAEKVSNNVGFVQDFVNGRDLTRLDGSWFAPTVVGLYGLSRAFRYAQNNSHTVSQERRDVFDANYGESTDHGSFATGATKTLDDYHANNLALGDLNAPTTSLKPLEDFLHKIEPTIPEANTTKS